MNSETFLFGDFLLTNYERLLEIAKESYVFTDYFTETSSKSIILRHDIDFSLHNAELMAQIENKLGIKSTYFIQLHSEFYNALDKESYDIIKRILELGHDLGLHFDSHFWGIQSEPQLEQFLLIDKSTMEKYFNLEIKTFAFHNTNHFTMSCEKERYAGMINVYSKYFKENVGYCSDSTGYWRFERLEDRLKEAKDKKLQILIHPGMWQNEVLPPRRRVFKIIDDKAASLKKLYDETLLKFGAKNVDWDEVYE
jgi:hypothetical protein